MHAVSLIWLVAASYMAYACIYNYTHACSDMYYTHAVTYMQIIVTTLMQL